MVVLKGKQRPIIDRKSLEASVRAKKGQTVVLNAK
jgi:type II secretory pathway component GspD/PulD (secretin)